MGNTNRKQTQFQQYWSQPTQSTILSHIPGSPKIIHSLYMNNYNNKEQQEIPKRENILLGSQQSRGKNIEAEYYTLEIINTNQDEQISIYKERKIGYKNIVGIYDFYTNKNILGCTMSALCYNIITERIQYRLAEFKNLIGLELLYIFHQALCGYECIAKYDKICYPNSEKIGIKQNGQIRVWINQNWASNYYIKCRNQRTSIETLWNCIKLCGNSTENIIGVCNDKIYGLGCERREYGFEDMIEMMRNQFGKEIIQGKFRFQKRVKDRKYGVEITDERRDNRGTSRPRAYSEEIVRKSDGEFGVYGYKSTAGTGTGTPITQKTKPKSTYPPYQPNDPKTRSRNQQPYTSHQTQRSLTSAKPQSVNFQHQQHPQQQQPQNNIILLTKSKSRNTQQFIPSSPIRGVQHEGGTRNSGQSQTSQFVISTKNNSPGQIKKQINNTNPPSPQIIKNINITHNTTNSNNYQIYPQSYPTTTTSITSSKYPSQQQPPQQQIKLTTTPNTKTQSRPSPPPPAHHTKNVQPNYYNILIQNKINSQVSRKTGGESYQPRPQQQQAQQPQQQQQQQVKNKTNIQPNINYQQDNGKRVNFSYKNSQFGVVGNLGHIVDNKYNNINGNTNVNINMRNNVGSNIIPNQNINTPRHHQHQQQQQSNRKQPSQQQTPPQHRLLPPQPQPQHQLPPQQKQPELYIHKTPTIILQPQPQPSPQLSPEHYQPITHSQHRQQLQQSPINRYPNPHPTPNTNFLQLQAQKQAQAQTSNISNFVPNPHKDQSNDFVGLNLDNVGRRYQYYSKTQRTTTNSPYVRSRTSRQNQADRERDSYRLQGSLDGSYQQQNFDKQEIRQMNVLEIEEMSYYSPQKTNKINRDPPPINFIDDTKQQQLDSKKVAQQFKYYLRSIQRTPQKTSQQNNNQYIDEGIYEEEIQDNYEELNSSKRIKYVYESNAPVIPERWDQEESLSQNF